MLLKLKKLINQDTAFIINRYFAGMQNSFLFGEALLFLKIF